ncbi:uncharacterized protein AMSG_08230 [Thecamonas trahens ATCC 50062]|uniref:Uncharacterized protein n=1 Tax=Thecamonas trahens ATCC 50062 TaxID=461836 RepID=A0A0L0DIB3_THETB|nr:hypothetical protein AMSG_08230 [Thecamonas trahens ATCC 50062]KNC51980.1 hypothetical protein AMSG_08230 [Thecamonas trahens ATCC 50062]|eukprot:XP_013755566.1 hypothetical protein AMSG_08230 [Thecamonas trahens ATCC 50062]
MHPAASRGKLNSSRNRSATMRKSKSRVVRGGGSGASLAEPAGGGGDGGDGGDGGGRGDETARSRKGGGGGGAGGGDEPRNGRLIKFRLSDDYGDAMFGRGVLGSTTSRVWTSSGRTGSAGKERREAGLGSRRPSTAGVVMSLATGGRDGVVTDIHVRDAHAHGDSNPVLHTMLSRHIEAENQTGRERNKQVRASVRGRHGRHGRAPLPGSHDPAAPSGVVPDEIQMLLPKRIQRRRWASLRYLKQLARNEKLKHYKNMTLRRIRDAQGGHPGSTENSGFDLEDDALQLPDDMPMAERKQAIARFAEERNKRLLASLEARTDAAERRKSARMAARRERVARHVDRVQAAKARQQERMKTLEERRWQQRQAVTTSFANKLVQIEKRRVDQYNLRQQLKLNGLEFEHAREEIHRMIRENPELTLEEIDRVIDELNTRSARVLAATTNMPMPPVEPLTIDDAESGDETPLTVREHLVSKIIRSNRSTIRPSTAAGAAGGGLRASILRSQAGKHARPAGPASDLAAPAAHAAPVAPAGPKASAEPPSPRIVAAPRRRASAVKPAAAASTTHQAAGAGDALVPRPPSKPRPSTGRPRA